jgi:hypothetical protein
VDRLNCRSKARQLNEQGPAAPHGPPSVETFELPEVASEGDLAVAEAILARLLARNWLSTHQGDSARPGGGRKKGEYYGRMDLTCAPPQGSVSRDGRDVSGAA